MSVREWIPHILLLTKLISIRLFLDMVPSSQPQQREIATFCIFWRTWTLRQPIFEISFSNLILSYIFCLRSFWRCSQIECRNVNSREIHGLKNKFYFFYRRVVFGIVAVAAGLNCFFMPGQRESTCRFDNLFVRLPSLLRGKQISQSFSYCELINSPKYSAKVHCL